MKQLSKIVNDRASLPIISTVLMNEKNVTGTNLETYITLEHGLNVKGQGCVNFKKFKTILDKLKQVDEIEFLNETILIKKGKTLLKLEAIDAEEFPKVPTDFNSIGSFTFGKDFVKAQKFVGKDELRPVMMGVFIDTAKIVSTDAHKMFFKAHNQTLSGTMLLGKDLFFLSGEYQVSKNKDGYIKLVNDEMTIVHREIDGKYPNYEAVIPQDNPIAISINKDELKESTEIALLTANPNTYKIVLNTELSKISSEDVDFGSESNIGLQIEKLRGENITIGYNGKFMLDVVSVLDEKSVKIEMSTPSRAMIINGQVLLMPIMLN